MKTSMSGHFYELPSVFPAAGTTFPIQSMYSLLPSSMEVVMTSHTSYGWFSAVGMQFILVPYTIKCYCCHTFHKLCQLRHPDCSCFDHHQNLGIIFYLPLPLVHTCDPWHEKIDTFISIHSVLLLTWNDVDASRELVGHQPARNLLGHVAAGRRHEGHGEVLGLPVGRGHPCHRVQPGPRHTRHQVPSLAQNLWHQHQQGHGYLHTF